MFFIRDSISFIFSYLDSVNCCEDHVCYYYLGDVVGNSEDDI